MNKFRTWLYGRDDDAKNGYNTSETNEISQQDSFQQTEGSEESKNKSPGKPTTKFEQAILTVVPLKPGDCLSCKIIGTLCIGITGFVILTSAEAGLKRNPHLQLQGPRQILYLSLCGALFIGFETVAVCRFMDWGPFDRPSVKE